MVRNSIKLPDLEQFKFPAPVASGRARVIGVVPNQLVTRHLIVDVADLPGTARLAVLERYGKNGNIAYAYVSGTGIMRGAVATSIAHDSHNVLILGVDDDDMRFAARELERMQGGVVAVLHGKILAAMPLGIGGLMSEFPAEVVSAQDRVLKIVMQTQLGVSLPEPVTTLSFLALPVIPSLKLTDQGLFDSEKFEFVPLYC